MSKGFDVSSGAHAVRKVDVLENNGKIGFEHGGRPVRYQSEFVVCIYILALDGLENARSEGFGPEYCPFDPLVDNGLQRGLQRALSHEGP